MLNIRTVVLSAALVVVSVLTVGLVAARTEIVSKTASNEASVSEIQLQPADLNAMYDALSYHSQFGECYDESISELAACREASQAAVDGSSIDECYDESISELISCRKASQGTTP